MLTHPMKEICNECGKSVKLGSGLFVNRVPSADSYTTQKKYMNKPFPEGGFMCRECECIIFTTDKDFEKTEGLKVIIL